MAFSFAFAVGVLLLFVSPELPPAWVALPLAALVVLAVTLRRYLPAGAVCGCALGFVYAATHAYCYLSQVWPVALAGERVIATAVVSSIPGARNGAWMFDALVSVEAPQVHARVLRARLVSWDAHVQPHAGERWRLLLTLEPPRARLNPGSPDMERMLFHDRIHALGSVVSSSFNTRLDTGHHPLDALRERVALWINERVADRDAAALIAALAVGVTSDMSREQWRVFNATGTTHLVAISGLHVTLFALVALAAARAMWTAVLYRLVPWKRESFAAVLGFTAAAAYATLAGLSVPTQRTLLMLGVWLLVRSMARASAAFHSFALALLAVLLLDPFAPLSAGFWLSFGAMAAIVFVTSSRFLPRPALVEALAIQAVVSVALVPLTVLFFGSVSVVGPLVNLVAIPAMSWVLVPTILGAVVMLPVFPAASERLLALAAWMHEKGWPWLTAAADLPWSVLHLAPPLWWYALAAISALACLVPLPLAVRLSSLLWLVPLSFAGAASVPSGEAEITVLNVGQGASVVVQTSHHVLVFGTGDAYGSDGRVAEGTLVPFLRSRGVQQIDVLVLDRLSPVSAPGVSALLAELPVRATLLGNDPPPDLPSARRCGAGGSWTWDGVSFRMLRPAAPVDGEVSTEPCPLLIESGRARVLIPGDVDAAMERRLVAAEPLSTDAVIVPRGGSNAASSAELVRAARARWAIVSGERMRNGKVRPAIRRWEQGGATVLATAELGAIRLRLHPVKGMEKPQPERSTRSALWRIPAASATDVASAAHAPASR